MCVRYVLCRLRVYFIFSYLETRLCACACARMKMPARTKSAPRTICLGMKSMTGSSHAIDICSYNSLRQM